MDPKTLTHSLRCLSTLNLVVSKEPLDVASVLAKLLKGIVNSPTTWLTARLRKVAAREAIDMILAAKERWKLFGVEKKEVFFLHRNSRYENTRTALFARNNNVNQGLI